MMATVMAWAGSGLDVVVLVLLATLVWRLGRDSGAWREREMRLRSVCGDLRTLVAQSEGLARDLDERLATREARLRALLGEAEKALGGVEPGSARRGGPAEGAATAAGSREAADDAEEAAAQIERLAEAGTAVDEIARRVGVAPAEVRLVIGLKAARAGRRRAADAKAVAHA